MRDDAWSESYVATQITSCGKLVGFIWTKLVPRTCPPEKSVHLETVAFRESRPVALPNPLHLATLSARLFPGSSILRAKVLAPSSVLELRAFQPRSYAVSLLVWISRLWNDWPTIKLLRRFNSSRPIVGKFEGIVFT